MAMQAGPTCTGTRVRSPADAHLILYAVLTKVLHKIERRLNTEEQRALAPEDVYVWEEPEQGEPYTEPKGLGIARWSDDTFGWGPSRVRNEFLYFQAPSRDNYYGPSVISFRPDLIKQTYVAFVETANGRRKWRLIAYLPQDSKNDDLRSVDDIPELACLRVPEGIIKNARKY